jgi:hypothetical protein
VIASEARHFEVWTGDVQPPSFNGSELMSFAARSSEGETEQISARVQLAKAPLAL